MEAMENVEPGRLMIETIRLIRETGIRKTCTLTQIPESWLYKLCNGTFKDPSVNRIEYIYNVLAATKLL